jgi:hypothetical protein
MFLLKIMAETSIEISVATGSASELCSDWNGTAASERPQFRVRFARVLQEWWEGEKQNERAAEWGQAAVAVRRD